ncbi:DUF6287 domain-containing protein [Nakamurella multipartita]|nr:DUF6287 domain-containing protein [Nakamurella multipartita]
MGGSLRGRALFLVTTVSVLSACTSHPNSETSPSASGRPTIESSSATTASTVAGDPTALTADSAEVTTSADAIAPGGHVALDTDPDLQQIAAGNYASLMGTWTEEAYAANPHDGTGEQWHQGRDGRTLDVTSNDIVYGSVTIHGGTLTYDAGNGPTSLPLSFRNEGEYLEASPVDQDVVINWLVRFYPNGTVDLNSDLLPNNGVTLDNSKNTIYIWSSNNGISEVFFQV